MAQFPLSSSIGIAEPLQEMIEFKTLTTKFDNLGKEQRKQKWLYLRRTIQVKYNYISKVNAKTIWNFYIARNGSYETFRFFYPASNTYLTEYVGTGNGSAVTFNLPSYQAASYTLYVDGVAKTASGTDYTFTSEGGTDGCDKAVFVIAPANGTRITWTFTGYLVVVCRFTDDNMNFETLYDRLVSFGLKLQGLLNDE
jgi:hypothetical protein